MIDIEVLIGLFAHYVITLIEGDNESNIETFDELLKELKKPCYSTRHTIAIFTALTDINVAYGNKIIDDMKRALEKLS